MDSTDIRDIKGYVPVPHGWLWLGLLGLVLALVIGWIWWRKRRRPAGSVAPAAPLPTPLEIALAALQLLRQADLSVEEFYTQLSAIVRQYLENQLQLRAPERTTEEFLVELAQGSRLTVEHKNLLGAFLQEADLVKFARHQPGPADRERAFESAEKFVRESSWRASLPASRNDDPAARQEPRPPSIGTPVQQK